MSYRNQVARVDALPAPRSATVELYGAPAMSHRPSRWEPLANVALRVLAYIRLVWRLQ